jgi:hypothetical protein
MEQAVPVIDLGRLIDEETGIKFGKHDRPTPRGNSATRGLTKRLLSYGLTNVNSNRADAPMCAKAGSFNARELPANLSETIP